MAVGGNLRYPSFQSIADLFRVSINDTMAGATNTPGEGLIMPNTNPDLLVFMNSAIRDVYSDLRNVGDPALILDNYILSGIPALTKSDPSIQVALSYAGYYDGYVWHSQWKLPLNCERMEKVWERAAGNGEFIPLTAAPNGLPALQQYDRMGLWEMRQNSLWMPGALVSLDLRLRCRIGFPDVFGTNLNFSTTYVPILNCTNAVVAKMLILYARRFAPEQYPVAIQEEKRHMDKLATEIVRQQQSAETERVPFGDAATSGFTL